MARPRPRSFGSVEQLPSGRWRAKYRTRNPKATVAAPDTFTTKTDAELWLDAQRVALDRGDALDHSAGKATLAEFADEWVKTRRTRDGEPLRPRTQELYRGLLKLHITPDLGDYELVRLTAPIVRRWHAALVENAGRTTGAKAYRLLRAVLHTAVADGAVARNPCNIRGAGEERSPERPVLTVEQVDLLAATVPPRFRALILVAAYSGLRLGELLALRRSSIVDGRVMVVGQRYHLNGVGKVMAPPKTAAGRRSVMLPKFVAVELNAHLLAYAEAGAEGFVFTGDRGGPLDRVHWGKVFRSARDATGLPADVKFHDLRHTGNTLAVQLGANQRDLMARMGHASEAAARRYLHTTKARDEAIAEALDGLVARAVPTG